MFHAALQEIARKLLERGFSSMGQFVLSDPAEGARGERLLRRLVDTFAPFRDMAEAEGGGGEILFHRKATWLLLRLHSLYSASQPSLTFTDLSSAPVGSDLATLALLERQGLVTPDNALAEYASLTASRFPEPMLRAAASRACSTLAAALTTHVGDHVPPYKALAYLHAIDEAAQTRPPPCIAFECRDTLHY